MGKKKAADDEGEELRLMVPETDEENAAFEKMQELLNSLDPDETKGHRWLMRVEDTAVLRFLRGHQGDVASAMEAIVAAAQWRFEYRVDTVLTEWPQDNSKEAMAIKMNWPMGICGSDKRGRPVQINRLGMTDFPGLYKHVGEFSMIRHNVYYLEKNLEMNPNISSVLIVDLGHSKSEVSPIRGRLDYRWFSKALAFLKALSPIFDHYPEMLHKVLIVRYSSLFYYMWVYYAKRLVNERTANKVVFVPRKNVVEGLKEYMDEDSIPKVLGGKSPIEIPGGGVVKLDD